MFHYGQFAPNVARPKSVETNLEPIVQGSWLQLTNEPSFMHDSTKRNADKYNDKNTD